MSSTSMSTFSESDKKKVSSWFLKNSWYIMIGLAISVGLAALLYMSVRKKVEQYTPAPTTFLSRQASMSFLGQDVDDFGKQFNPVNLEACGVASYADLLDKWSTSAADFQPQEKDRVKQAALLADYQIKQKLNDPLSSQLANIPWQFGKTIHPYYLDGLPHTRADIIFLTDRILAVESVQSLASMLVHEKVHLWQRKHPEEMQGWIENRRYKAVKRIVEDGLQRLNPDVDQFIYTDENQEFGVRYNSVQPRSLYDVSGYNKDLDHPYEQMAYLIQIEVFPEVD